MAEEPKKSRRRRRPRTSSKNRSKATAKSQKENTPGFTGNRRGRSRRRPSGANKTKKRSQQEELAIQRHTEEPITPINKDVFIYTYTLRPRSLLDSYEAGPNVAEKMAFEQSTLDE